MPGHSRQGCLGDLAPLVILTGRRALRVAGQGLVSGLEAIPHAASEGELLPEMAEEISSGRASKRSLAQPQSLNPRKDDDAAYF